jgi:tetratricopeptide (TPR) repeat protein
MKILYLSIFLFVSLNSWGQTAQEYLDRGMEKHEKQDLKGALKDYTKAIKGDKTLSEAYLNRGNVKLALQDLKGALSDLNKSISLNDKSPTAFYSRASVYASQGKYKESIPDLDRTIELDETFPNVLTLRGQIHFALKDKEAACKDFQRANEIGDPAADAYLSKFCGNEQQKGESLMLYWPEDENWKMENSQETKEMIMIELLRNEETFDNWTEIGTMQSLKGAVDVDLDVTMDAVREQAKSNCPDAKIVLIEKNEAAEFPWIIFSVECASYKSSKTAESQIWYIVQGKEALYMNFRAVKEATVPVKTKEKWIAFFKTGKVMYK